MSDKNPFRFKGCRAEIETGLDYKEDGADEHSSAKIPGRVPSAKNYAPVFLVMVTVN